MVPNNQKGRGIFSIVWRSYHQQKYSNDLFEKVNDVVTFKVYISSSQVISYFQTQFVTLLDQWSKDDKNRQYWQDPLINQTAWVRSTVVGKHRSCVPKSHTQMFRLILNGLSCNVVYSCTIFIFSGFDIFQVYLNFPQNYICYHSCYEFVL